MGSFIGVEKCFLLYQFDFRKNKSMGLWMLPIFMCCFWCTRPVRKKQGSSFVFQHVVKQLSECPNKVLSFCAAVGDEL